MALENIPDDICPQRGLKPTPSRSLVSVFVVGKKKLCVLIQNEPSEESDRPARMRRPNQNLHWAHMYELTFFAIVAQFITNLKAPVICQLRT